MTMILTKIQYVKVSSGDLTSGEAPYYEENGRFFLKDTHEEIVITDEKEITYDR